MVLSSDVKKITVKQVRSPIRHPSVQRKILVGLGLDKMNRCRVLEDTPSVRGMIHAVRHLVRIVE